MLRERRVRGALTLSVYASLNKPVYDHRTNGTSTVHQPDMNVNQFSALTQGTGAPQPGQHGPARTSEHGSGQGGRAREAAAAPATSAPQGAQARHPEARPVLDPSDSTLTRRNIPRGSIVNIVV